MNIVLLLILLIFAYRYVRFLGKRSYYRKMVMALEEIYRKQAWEKNALELASAYMMVQRYKDAYNLFAAVLDKYPTPNAETIRQNMKFCEKPLPWSQGLRNHNMGYWHDRMILLFGSRRCVMLSQDAYTATDNYGKY